MPTDHPLPTFRSVLLDGITAAMPSASPEERLRIVNRLIGDAETAAKELPPQDRATTDQIAAVMLRTGSPPQVAEALAYASGVPTQTAALKAAEEKLLEYGRAFGAISIAIDDIDGKGNNTPWQDITTRIEALGQLAKDIAVIDDYLNIADGHSAAENKLWPRLDRVARLVNRSRLVEDEQFIASLTQNLRGALSGARVARRQTTPFKCDRSLAYPDTAKLAQSIVNKLFASTTEPADAAPDGNSGNPEALPWEVQIPIGAYVLATKYSDGDPGDAWALGYYDGFRDDRYFVKNVGGGQCRAGGYRRVARIRKDVGNWLWEHRAALEASPPGVINLWAMLTPAAFKIAPPDPHATG